MPVRKPEPAVTVVIPCCNEAAGLPMLLDRLEGLVAGSMRGWEILFVDDGSTDRTFAELLSASRARPWMTVLRHPTNMGLGTALRTGFANTLAPIVCSVDSDCTYAPERLPELVALVEAGADIATASAWHPGSVKAEGSPVRIALSRAVSGVYKLLIGQDIHTFTCLFRAYRRSSLERVHFWSNGFASVAEIMLRGMLAGYRVAELPMQLERRRFGTSKLKVGDAIAAHVGLLALTASLVFATRTRRLLPRRSVA